MHKTFNSIPPKVRTLLIVLIAIFMIIVIFSLGMLTGNRRGEFGERWDRHYGEIMAPVSHGAAGEVIAINYPSIIVRGPQDVEKVIIINPQTIIRRFHDTATTSDITIGSWIIAIGNPDEKGEVQAALIRIMPPPPVLGTTTMMGTSTFRGPMMGSPKPY